MALSAEWGVNPIAALDCIVQKMPVLLTTTAGGLALSLLRG